MIEQIYTYFTIEMIFMWLNLGVLPFWFVLIVFPQSQICRVFITSIFPIFILSLAYGYLLYLFFNEGYDFIKNFDIRGEIVMPIDGFKKLNSQRVSNGEEPFKNPRNTASGSLKMQDSKEVSKRPLECLLYSIVESTGIIKSQYESLEIAKKWGFNVSNEIKLAKSIEEVFEFVKHWEINRSNLPFEIDGVVIKVNDTNQQNELGFTSKFPRWAISYKFKPEQSSTVLNSITYQVGRTGSITPVANFAPIDVADTVVKSFST